MYTKHIDMFTQKYNMHVAKIKLDKEKPNYKHIPVAT